MVAKRTDIVQKLSVYRHVSGSDQKHVMSGSGELRQLWPIYQAYQPSDCHHYLTFYLSSNRKVSYIICEKEGLLLM